MELDFLETGPSENRFDYLFLSIRNKLPKYSNSYSVRLSKQLDLIEEDINKLSSLDNNTYLQRYKYGWVDNLEHISHQLTRLVG